jgi:hypothetical protein
MIYVTNPRWLLLGVYDLCNQSTLAFVGSCWLWTIVSSSLQRRWNGDESTFCCCCHGSRLPRLRQRKNMLQMRKILVPRSVQASSAETNLQLPACFGFRRCNGNEYSINYGLHVVHLRLSGTQFALSAKRSHHAAHHSTVLNVELATREKCHAKQPHLQAPVLPLGTPTTS